MPIDNNEIHVLDFTHLLPGELCSMMLSDLGCNITRIEALEPGLGYRLPPVVKGESLYYWSLHRNQRRVSLNLKSPAGLDIVRKLVQTSDVVVENFRPGVMQRLGLGYDQLQPLNERLIYCSISGYGHNSSWSQRPGHDLNYQAEAGIVDLNRSPGQAPVLPAVLVSDYTAGIYAALSVMSALFERERTGLGKALDVSMFECTLSTLNILATRLLYTGQDPGDGKFAVPSELPNYNIYECSDGRYLAVASLEPKFWAGFCERLQHPEWGAQTPIGADQALKEKIAQIIAAHPLSHWQTVFENSDCCVSAVHTLREALDYLPAIERGLITHLDHPVLGKVPQLTSPVFNHNGGTKLQAANADKAAQTAALLSQLGYSDEEVHELSRQQVIPELPVKC